MTSPAHIVDLSDIIAHIMDPYDITAHVLDPNDVTAHILDVSEVTAHILDLSDIMAHMMSVHLNNVSFLQKPANLRAVHRLMRSLHIYWTLMRSVYICYWAYIPSEPKSGGHVTITHQLLVSVIQIFWVIILLQ